MPLYGHVQGLSGGGGRDSVYGRQIGGAGALQQRGVPVQDQLQPRRPLHLHPGDQAGGGGRLQAPLPGGLNVTTFYSTIFYNISQHIRYFTTFYSTSDTLQLFTTLCRGCWNTTKPRRPTKA